MKGEGTGGDTSAKEGIKLLSLSLLSFVSTVCQMWDISIPWLGTRDIRTHVEPRSVYRNVQQTTQYGQKYVDT